MGLFDKKYKRINEQNKQKIIKLLDELMEVNPAYVVNINNITNTLLHQPATEGKEVAKIDEQIILYLSEAKKLLVTGKTSNAGAYIDKVKELVAQRTGSSGDVKKDAKAELTADQLAKILRSQAEDNYNALKTKCATLRVKANNGDMVARSQVAAAMQEYQIAVEIFREFSFCLNRNAIADMLQTLTEEQKQRIANRSVSDEELTVLIKRYCHIAD